MDRDRLRSLFDMTGRVVVVTGGTRGIGRALAEGYVAAGAKVVVASRKAQACEETEKHLRSLGGDALGVPTHLGEIDALHALVEKTVGEKQASREADEKEALAAKDGNALVTIGLNYVYEGNAAKGLPMIEQGIKKGGLKRPEDAKLRYGEALLHAGRKDRAVQVLRGVKGTDGTADIARLWVLQARARFALPGRPPRLSSPRGPDPGAVETVVPMREVRTDILILGSGGAGLFAALHAREPQAQLLASVGTAMTLDLLDAGGRHHGGLILPAPQLMRASLRSGTARGIDRDFPYVIAGKTGTAERFSRTDETWTSISASPIERHQVLFEAFTPAEDARIAVIVALEAGRSGAHDAAPIVRKILDAWLPGDIARTGGAPAAPPPGAATPQETRG